MNTDPGRSPSIVTSIADWGNLFKGRVGPVCVKKFSVKPSSQYRYSFMSESEECRAWARRGRTTGGSPDVRISDPNQEWSSLCPPGKGEGTRACTSRGFRRQTRPGRPEGKNFYTHTPARTLRPAGAGACLCPPGGLFGPCGPLGPIQQAAGPAALTDKQRFLRLLPTCSALFTLHSALFQSLPASPASSLSRTGHRSAHRRPASSGDSST